MKLVGLSEDSGVVHPPWQLLYVAASEDAHLHPSSPVPRVTVITAGEFEKEVNLSWESPSSSEGLLALWGSHPPKGTQRL